MNERVRNKKITVLIALILMNLCLIAQKTYSTVSISEIMFASWERLTPSQWIELYNAGTDPVSLVGWTLTIQNRASPDLTGPVNATITFEVDRWGGNAPQILPNETILIVSRAPTTPKSRNLLEGNVYGLWQRQKQLDLGFRDTILSAEGFYLKLTDSAGNLVDEAGNFDGNVLQWQLPLGIIWDRNERGYRVSMIRRYVNGVPLDGTTADSWVSAVNANLTADQLTYYGDTRDISSPGIGPDMPVVDCQVGMVLVQRQSCTYPGTDTKFSVLGNGDGKFLDTIFTSKYFIDINVNDQPYILAADKQNDGSWLIENVGTGTPPPVDMPVVDCQVGAVLKPGQSCTYPGTDLEFSVLSNGEGRFLDIIFTSINLRDTNINDQFYTLVGNKRDDGSWTIEDVGTGEQPVDMPVVDCQVGAVLKPGQSCTYPGTDLEFSVLSSGNGRFLDFTFTSINLRDTNINDQFYTLVADKQNDGSWLIENVGTGEQPVDMPMVDCQVGTVLEPGQSCTYPGTDTKFSVLNFGAGRFLSFIATEFNLRDTNINGQPYTLVAGPHDGNAWRIEEIGLVEEPAAVNPQDQRWLLWGQLKANRGLADSTEYR